MANKKLLARAEELSLSVGENESDEDLQARINEAQNSREFDATTAEPVEKTREEYLAEGKCPDCKGQGIRNPEIDTQVCATCGGTGKA